MVLETVAISPKREKKKPNVDRLMNTHMSGDLLTAGLSSKLVAGLPAARLLNRVWYKVVAEVILGKTEH